MDKEHQQYWDWESIYLLEGLIIYYISWIMILADLYFFAT